MGLSSFFFLFMSLSAENINGGRQEDDCKASRCSLHGPVIRSPFRLKHQPDHCGYLEFELSCSKKNQTILELPYSVKLSVLRIDYSSQSMFVQHLPEHCLQNLNLSASPFHHAYRYPLHAYSIFNCSEKKEETFVFTFIPCSYFSSKPVYAISSSYDLLSEVNLSSCWKIFDATRPEEDILLRRGGIPLKWSIPKCLQKKNSGMECKGAPIDKMVLIEVILGVLHFTFGISVIFVVYRSNKLKREHKINIQKLLDDYRALKPSRYNYTDIKKITSNFKDKIGQGGYGTVYKGKLSNEVFVAIKVLDDFTANGEEFINEVGTMSTIHHFNIVRLLGFCADGYKRALIYEFLPNESLDRFIFSTFGDNCSLGWHKLQNIAIGIAKGIEYLHQGCNQRILHLDIKPQNILLDHNLNPKISDFGLAKLCSKEQSAISMTLARGTMGYIAPEMLSRNNGNVSCKSDVYSFGMLLIEIIGGRKNIDISIEHNNETYFPEWLYNYLNQDQEVHIRIEEERDIKIATKLSIIGLWCIQWHPIDRPSMKTIVGMLEREEENLVMPPNPFAFVEQTQPTIRRHKTCAQPDE